MQCAWQDASTRTGRGPTCLHPWLRCVSIGRFFRQAKDADYLRRTILAGLPPLPQRCMEIRMVSHGVQQCLSSALCWRVRNSHGAHVQQNNGAHSSTVVCVPWRHAGLLVVAQLGLVCCVPAMMCAFRSVQPQGWSMHWCAVSCAGQGACCYVGA